MKLTTLFASKSFLFKIVLWISASVLCIVGILSVIIYLNAQNLMIKKESDNSKKILLQVKYNTNIMNETMSRLTQSLYINNDITSIMYAEQENIVDVITRLNNVVNSLTSSYPYIHSISVYNRNLDQFYNAGSPIFFDDPQFNRVDRQQGNNIYLLDQHGDYTDVDENQENADKLKWLKNEVLNHTKKASSL